MLKMKDERDSGNIIRQHCEDMAVCQLNDLFFAGRSESELADIWRQLENSIKNLPIDYHLYEDIKKERS